MTNPTNGNHYRKEKVNMWERIDQLENPTSGVQDIQRGPIFIVMLACFIAIYDRYM